MGSATKGRSSVSLVSKFEGPDANAIEVMMRDLLVECGVDWEHGVEFVCCLVDFRDGKCCARRIFAHLKCPTDASELIRYRPNWKWSREQGVGNFLMSRLSRNACEYTPLILVPNRADPPIEWTILSNMIKCKQETTSSGRGGHNEPLSVMPLGPWPRKGKYPIKGKRYMMHSNALIADDVSFLMFTTTHEGGGWFVRLISGSNIGVKIPEDAKMITREGHTIGCDPSSLSTYSVHLMPDSTPNHGSRDGVGTDTPHTTYGAE